jgi:hypothetical protein
MKPSRFAARTAAALACLTLAGWAGGAQLGTGTPQSPTAKLSAKDVEPGRYLVQITGCNDCHTREYLLDEGKVPEEHWLTGDTLGWRGPWGTTYPPNLRMFMRKFSEDQWVKLAKNLRSRPPMPSFTLREMKEKDLRAIYRFVRFLGPAGGPVPAYLPPGQEPPQPYVQFPMPPK